MSYNIYVYLTNKSVFIATLFAKTRTEKNHVTCAFHALNVDDTEFMVMLKPSCIIYRPTTSVEKEGAFVPYEIWHET